MSDTKYEIAFEANGWGLSDLALRISAIIHGQSELGFTPYRPHGTDGNSWVLDPANNWFLIATERNDKNIKARLYHRYGRSGFGDCLDEAKKVRDALEVVICKFLLVKPIEL